MSAALPRRRVSLATPRLPSVRRYAGTFRDARRAPGFPQRSLATSPRPTTLPRSRCSQTRPRRDLQARWTARSVPSVRRTTKGSPWWTARVECLPPSSSFRTFGHSAARSRQSPTSASFSGRSRRRRLGLQSPSPLALRARRLSRAGARSSVRRPGPRPGSSPRSRVAFATRLPPTSTTSTAVDRECICVHAPRASPFAALPCPCSTQGPAAALIRR